MKYSISNTGNGWLLKIWEPSPIRSDSSLPFLYQIKTLHATQADALEALATHQTMNEYHLMQSAS
ncbi:MAG: hypothetical protein HC881_15160 [Leptolyngbyaceae cyanobacterium SL_7_1]|nr:hypothetical protein [Leptolyngbyaceae cyanobacterium SL_7_1]